MNWTVYGIECAVSIVLFTCMVIIPLCKDPVWWIHDYPKDIQEDVGMPKNAVLGRMYTQGVKLEPGDRTGNAIEGIAALDKRPLDEQARDPLATNKVEKTTFLLPFGREDGERKDDKEEK